MQLCISACTPLRLIEAICPFGDTWIKEPFESKLSTLPGETPGEDIASKQARGAAAK
jgi:hypothetical protein